jgi:hypothetical protein
MRLRLVNILTTLITVIQNNIRKCADSRSSNVRVGPLSLWRGSTGVSQSWARAVSSYFLCTSGSMRVPSSMVFNDYRPLYA